MGVDETSHEGSRQDGRDAEQCCCQTYGHDISAQRGDKKGERGQQCMKVNENEEINQTYLDERADPEFGKVFRSVHIAINKKGSNQVPKNTALIN